MPRKKQVQYDEPQKYDIGNGVRVTVEWPKGQRPKMQHLDTVVIIGDHVCGDAPRARAESPAQESTGTPGGATLDDVRAFQALREAPRPKPFTSEDAARQAGFPTAALTFENL